MTTFTKIALSLSGGGYRAASFHLGTLVTLDELGLLDSVKILSTVSGGTITGAALAVSSADKMPFDLFFKRFAEFLKSTNVIGEALEKLSASSKINQSNAMPSLIRAAASIYAADDLLGDKKLDHLVENCPAFEDISFNATDFRTGNSFRFQKSGRQTVYSGNKYAQISAEINKKIRLADIVAASSCFPSGFEPLRFPADFVWSDETLSSIENDLGETFKGQIPLMDGGVFDNQGIDSIFNIAQRKNQTIDLIIVSDTDRGGEVILDFPPVANAGRLKLKYLNWILYVIQIASLVTAAAVCAEVFFNFQTSGFNWFGTIFLYLIPLLFSLTVVIASFYLRSLASRLLLKFNDESGIELWTFFKNLTVPQLVVIAESRLKSLIKMSSSVFMKRIRDLGYSRLYADVNLREKVIANQIYDLNKTIHFKPEWAEFITEAEFLPTKQLKDAADKAASYATNLWFLDSSELENLVMCGRATMCYNILDYLLEKRSEKLTDGNSPEFELFSKAKQLWLKMNDRHSTA